MILRRALKLAAVVALLLVFTAGAYAWSNGLSFYAVDSGSMAPTFNTGALVIDTPVTQATVLQVGDVVTFHPTPGYTATHRIVAIGADGITTRGDANPSSDVGTIEPGMIAGRVALSVPYGGYVAVFLQHPAGIIALVAVIIGLVVVWEFRNGDDDRQPAAVTASEELP